MGKKIKLENLMERGYDRLSGELKIEVTNEYVCSGCRHSVNVEDNFCWHCGEGLMPSSKLEHYHKGERLTDKEFKKRVGKL